MEKSFALKGDIAFTERSDSFKTVQNGYLVCTDGICSGVFETLPEMYRDLPILDFSEKLIIPGLVDLHVHAPQFAYRGTGMDLELMDWLQQVAFPEETKYSDLAYADQAYAIFADAMQKSATTRAVMFASRHREATELLMDKMEASGIVSYVGKVNMDREAPDPLREKNAEESASETEKWIADVAGKYQNTYPIITPRFLPSCTNELLERLSDMIKRTRLPVQSHLSENLGEIALVKSLFPASKFYGDAYDSFGMFGGYSKTVMAHCVYSESEEISLMKERGVFVAHCPASNENISSGIAPVRKYLDAGLKVGLGSDVAGGETISMFRAVTDAIKVSKLYWRIIDNNSKPLTFDESFWLGTKSGGAFFGKVGSFEPGYEFDAMVLDDSLLPHVQPMNIHQRVERAFYLGLDIIGINAKFARGARVF